MGVYTHTEGNWLSRRGGFLVLLVLFHVLLYFGVKSGFAVKLIEAVTPPIVADIINEVKPEEPPPPPPEVQIVEVPPVSVPPVLVDIRIPEPPKAAIQVVTDRPPAPTPAPPAPPAPVRQAVVQAFRVTDMPDPRDYYPSTSLQLEEEGVVKVNMCYGANGRVTETSVSESSGHARLDQAGVRLARQVRVSPEKIDGVAKADCKVLPVRFSLKDGN